MKTQLFKFACLIICLLTIAPNCHAGSKWKAKHVVLDWTAGVPTV